MSVSGKIFEIEIIVTTAHLDAMDHVNNVVFVQFMQEVAYQHWDSVAESAVQDNVIWVVRRHEVDYLSSAFLHDQLLVRTWTGEHTAVTWARYCEIIRKQDQKKIISSKSIWVLIDKESGKPKRIDGMMLKRFG